MRHRPLRLLVAIAALALATGPGAAQERVKPKPVEGVPQPQTPSPNKPATAAPAVPAPVIASPAPWASDLPQDQDTTARIGGLADEAMGGADCRTVCATSYYSCLAQDDSTACSADWSKCLVACPPVSAGEWTVADRLHRYEVEVEWTGDQGQGTASYRGYRRDHLIRSSGKPDIPGSSDPAFNGDPSRWNPEELLLASLSACHELWYLHLCAVGGVTVTGYVDRCQGWMEETADGSGRFVRMVLRPRVTIAAGSNPVVARDLHHKAHEMCFIARSVNFPVECEAEIVAG